MNSNDLLVGKVATKAVLAAARSRVFGEVRGWRPRTFTFRRLLYIYIYIYGGVYLVAVNYITFRPRTSESLGAHQGLAH